MFAANVAVEFDREADLWAIVLDRDRLGWTLRDDGRLLRPAHAAIAVCDEQGDEAATWQTHPINNSLVWRFCPRCGSRFEQCILTRPRTT